MTVNLVEDVEWSHVEWYPTTCRFVEGYIFSLDYERKNDGSVNRFGKGTQSHHYVMNPRVTDSFVMIGESVLSNIVRLQTR